MAGRIKVRVLAIACAIFGTAMLVRTFVFDHGTSETERLADEVNALRTRNGTLSKTIRERRDELEDLKSSAEVQRNVIRQELGLVGPDEWVLENPEGDAP